MVDAYPAHVVHVLTVRQNDPDVRAALDRCRSLLSAEERAREARLHFEADRERYVIGRALTRLQLSRFLGGDPRDWRFVTNAHGRPELAVSGERPPPLGFNVSHTSGMVACAVAATREVGVDVECVDRRLAHDVADRFFAPREIADLRALPASDQPRAFFDYWTLKEAYIKARGMGLALPLARFAFRLAPDRTPTISFEADVEDIAESWQFFQAWPTELHRLAVAVRRPPEAEVEVRLDGWTPRVDA
ncbi:MAG TPA: 4'-phosphopantetheinyl transferase superfamily protein [Vicinamibacterales bacterium]|mgnify:CR=1 FL=1|nr:4'-phosphopantetheinyl transferase superfamily protein [Vicinamibacterales bacterium]